MTWFRGLFSNWCKCSKSSKTKENIKHREKYVQQEMAFLISECEKMANLIEMNEKKSRINTIE